MSYILDALKKSEQERGHGSIPGVQTVHSSSLNYTSKKTYWPYILIFAVILNLIAILYFIFYQDKPAENIATIETEDIENNTGLKAMANSTPTDAAFIPVRHPVETSSITVGKHTEKDMDDAITAPITSAEQQIASPPETDNKTKSSTRQATARADTSFADDNASIVEFDELPESIKQQLPAIIITAHVYSTNPLQRSVVINNNFMEEGEYFLDDLVLDEITTDGAIFHYRDIKFHLGVVSGWQ